MAIITSGSTLTNQYLDKSGLAKFYGIIKDQWTNADTSLKNTITGEYTKAINQAINTVNGELVTITDVQTQQAEAILTLQGADTELSNRIASLEAGSIDPTWMSQTWLSTNIDNDTLSVNTDNEESTIKLPNGSEVSYKPITISANFNKLSFSRENDTVALKFGETELGNISLSEIVMDRVLHQGEVIYDSTDKDPEEGFVNEGDKSIAYPYMVFTILTYKNGNATAEKEYIRVPVTDLIDTYTAGEGLTMTPATITPNGSTQARTIKLSDATVAELGALRSELNQEKVDRANEDSTINGTINSKIAEVTQAIANGVSEAKSYTDEKIGEINDTNATLEERVTNLDKGITIDSNGAVSDDSGRVSILEYWATNNIISDAEIEAICGVSNV